MNTSRKVRILTKLATIPSPFLSGDPKGAVGTAGGGAKRLVNPHTGAVRDTQSTTRSRGTASRPTSKKPPPKWDQKSFERTARATGLKPNSAAGPGPAQRKVQLALTRAGF